MQEELVTIVLSIYNVEKYLERCLKSVVNQTYKKLEIILVDDGSPDNCPEICEKWAKKDSRIKVVHKKNAGLGMARNTGIENATGKYICFFDSDDYIALDAIEKAYTLLKREAADIVIFGFCNVKKNGDTGITCIPHPDKMVYEGKEVQRVFLPNLIGPDTATGESTDLWMSAWTSMYSLDLIRRKEWRWVSERAIISEDIYSLLELYRYVKKVAILPEALYFYCENETSLTHTYRKDRYEKIKYFYDACMKRCDELKYGKAVIQRLAHPYLSNTIAAMKMIVAADCPENEKKQNLKDIIGSDHLQGVLRKTDFRKEKITRKILLTAMKKKDYRLCYMLLKAKG